MKTRFIATRNGVPCYLADLNVPHLPRIKNILLPSPIPPEPHVFRSEFLALSACNRTARAGMRLRTSIHADFIYRKFPLLRSLLTEATYKPQVHKVAVAVKQSED